jgi:hypothetical protein
VARRLAVSAEAPFRRRFLFRNREGHTCAARSTSPGAIAGRKDDEGIDIDAIQMSGGR